MRHRAFSLIELLVVIAIVAILAAILFPVFARARDKGQQTQCMANMRQMTIAIDIYRDDNDGRVPTMADAWLLYTCPLDKEIAPYLKMAPKEAMRLRCRTKTDYIVPITYFTGAGTVEAIGLADGSHRDTAIGFKLGLRPETGWAFFRQHKE